MTYFEFNEHRTQRSVAVDVVDWPGITVTEGDLSDDQLLELSLTKWTPAMDPALGAMLARKEHP